jgi:hypothetical protein
MPNAELAYRVLDHIDAHPDQHVWIEQREDCGTAACLAGWVVLLAGDEPNFDPDEPEACEVVIGGGTVLLIKERAADLLGIEYNPDKFFGHELFDQHNTRQDLGRLVAEIFGPRPGGES